MFFLESVVVVPLTMRPEPLAFPGKTLFEASWGEAPPHLQKKRVSYSGNHRAKDQRRTPCPWIRWRCFGILQSHFADTMAGVPFDLVRCVFVFKAT